MHSFIRATALLCLCLAAAAVAAAQNPVSTSGLITGRVTSDGKPAAGVEIVLLPEDGEKRTVAGKATTDAEGRFRLTVEYAGRYRVVPAAPALVPAQASASTAPGKAVTIAAGEEVAGVELALTRGGVITGQVRTPDGQPAVAERVTVTPVGDTTQARAATFQTSVMFETDDRGVYRIFGLPAGRYLVSAGSSNAATPNNLRGRRAAYARTYHPDATEEARAAVVEVAAGGEAASVDINLARRARSFAASGRVVDAKTGQPAAGLPLAYVALQGTGRPAGVPVRGARADANGEFRIDGLLPGRYLVFVSAEDDSNAYSDDLTFDVPTDEDVSGLELKAHQGASVSGVMFVENTRDAGLARRLSGLSVNSFLYQTDATLAAQTSARINADGTFRLAGLRPGKLKAAMGTQQLPRGFSIVRLERDGVAQGDGIEVQPEANITGVRVVLAYGNGVVRGRVQPRAGELPAGARLLVAARKLGADAAHSTSSVEVDARGHFAIEWLTAGEYELTLSTRPAAGGAPRGVLGRQVVRVTDNGEVEVTLVYDPNAPAEGAQ
ncbi:MAG TPA: carboxypeptidase regulatory-like domain-containing protein [Pyrinomonadaceae bacterium]